MINIAYHEAGHAVMAYETMNLNYGLKLYNSGYVLGTAFQTFRISKYISRPALEVLSEINGDEEELIMMYFKGYILTLLAGQQAENIYNKIPPKIYPHFQAESDDEKFGDALMWYCQFKSFSLDKNKLFKCYEKINTQLYDIIKNNRTIWSLIEVLAEKLYHSDKKELTGSQTIRIILCKKIRLSFKGRHLPQFEINTDEIIEKTCK